MSRRSLFSLISLSVLLGLGTAPAQAEQSIPGRSSVTAPVKFTAHDYGFDGPDHIPAGTTTLQLVNRGHDLHQIQLLRLRKGKTAEDFRTALLATGGQLPDWIKYVGGPNAIVPGEESAATMNLVEGEYLLICLIPNKDGVPHVALGMQKPLSVKGGKPSLVSEPKAGITITQTDYRFALSAPLTAGSHTIRVMNQGKQPHEVVVVKLNPGVSAKEFAEGVELNPSAPPPGLPIGGVVGVEQGEHAYFTTRFEPGRYGLICFFPDPATGKAHFMQGMSTEFTVR
ncbi:MAG: hypothetical protein A4E19_07675 [Nitrospira sp. SG-bin1]|nr:MAG: hypothetical protein A4E19_07675 [Nitrospira sp. SG-bin1]